VIQHSPPNPGLDCWLHPAVEVRDSAIEGRGLFAARPIRRGELVSRVGGRLVTTKELHSLFDESVEYIDTIAVGNDLNLVLPRQRPNGYGNHSCDPNLWWEGPYDLVARRDVPQGEELTNDYATSTIDLTWGMPCHCGAASCRGEISGHDWQRIDLDKLYEGHIVPAVLEAIASRR